MVIAILIFEILIFVVLLFIGMIALGIMGKLIASENSRNKDIDFKQAQANLCEAWMKQVVSEYKDK